MKEITNLDDIMEFCTTLGSPIRIGIIKILKQKRSVNLNDLAEQLGVTNGAITSHIKKLYDEGIIDIEHSPGKRGIQKTCCLKQHKFLIDLSSEFTPANSYELSIPVGSYTRHHILPTCGIAARNAVIGVVDDPRCFDDPKRNEAGILWFTKGFIEYRIPNYLRPNQKVDELQISMEISSEAPGYCDNWPSDIHFSLNGIFIGNWISPGDFGSVKGLYTPDWWYPYWNQYGLLKLLSVTRDGTYLDGRKISDVTIGQFDLNDTSTIDFRLSVTDESETIGGLTIFGRGFGNYNQDINARVMFHKA
jgi:predicted transcriptional regulator